jgi:conjugative relaxase-like TrwC/TraI family protein
MLSLARPSSADYYFHYLTGEQEERLAPSRWLGSGAKALGLTGPVAEGEFRNLFEGFSPDGTTPLVQNAGDKRRHHGTDAVFSRPKSVSIVEQIGSPWVAREVNAGDEAAVAAAIQAYEALGAYTRCGKGGWRWEKVGLVVAALPDEVSRANDMQNHTHCVICGMGLRSDGTFGALVSHELYKLKMALGAIYRTELAHQLQMRLGVTVRKAKTSFEIEGVPQKVIDEFSKRRAAIVKSLAARGAESAQAAATAALATRPAKQGVKLDEQREAWRAAAASLGFDERSIERLVRAPRSLAHEAKRAEQAVTHALKNITASHSHFSEGDVVRHAATEGQLKGVSAAAILTAVRKRLENEKEIVRLGTDQKPSRYTTVEIWKQEQSLLSSVEALRRDQSHLVSDKTLKRVLAKNPQLSSEQVAALKHITQQSGAIALLTGVPGSGKSTLFQAAKQAWEREGFKVLGAAPMGKAAQGLQESSGIRSATLWRTIDDLYATPADNAAHHAKQLWRAFRHKPTYGLNRIAVGRKTIVVVDEAAMVGTKDLAALAAAVSRRGGKLVLGGDPKQLQSIAPGGGFAGVAKRQGSAELKEIRRQKDPWARDAVLEVGEGKAEHALGKSAERGLVTVAKDRREAMTRMLADWRKDSVPLEKRLMVAPSNVDVDQLNRAAQSALKKSWSLSARHFQIGGERFHVGDRIVFTQNSAALGVKNGHLGTIENVALLDRKLTVRLDSGRAIEFQVKRYQHLKLAYCVSLHRAQGMTVYGNVYALLGGRMQDRELSYVELSRATNITRLYADRFEAGPKLAELAAQMNKSNQKTLAHDAAADGRRSGMAPERGR